MQTGGRGRHGNQWVSPMGNLYISLLLRPDCKADDAGQITFVVALALSKTMDEFIDPSHTKTLKWPNDVLTVRKSVGFCWNPLLNPGGAITLLSGSGSISLRLPKGVSALMRSKTNLCLSIRFVIGFWRTCPIIWTGGAPRALRRSAMNGLHRPTACKRRWRSGSLKLRMRASFRALIRRAVCLQMLAAR